MGDSSGGEQDVNMALVACNQPVGSPCSTHTPESLVMSGVKAPRMSLAAAPVTSSSHAQVCILHTDDVRHTACLHTQLYPAVQLYSCTAFSA